jgi:hypothetical protein
VSFGTFVGSLPVAVSKLVEFMCVRLGGGLVGLFICGLVGALVVDDDGFFVRLLVGGIVDCGCGATRKVDFLKRSQKIRGTKTKDTYLCPRFSTRIETR